MPTTQTDQPAVSPQATPPPTSPAPVAASPQQLAQRTKALFSSLELTDLELIFVCDAFYVSKSPTQTDAARMKALKQLELRGAGEAAIRSACRRIVKGIDDEMVALKRQFDQAALEDESKRSDDWTFDGFAARYTEEMSQQDDNFKAADDLQRIVLEIKGKTSMSIGDSPKPSKAAGKLPSLGTTLMTHIGARLEPYIGLTAKDAGSLNRPPIPSGPPSWKTPSLVRSEEPTIQKKIQLVKEVVKDFFDQYSPEEAYQKLQEWGLPRAEVDQLLQFAYDLAQSEKEQIAQIRKNVSGEYEHIAEKVDAAQRLRDVVNRVHDFFFGRDARKLLLQPE